MMDGILMTLAVLFLAAAFLVYRVVRYKSRADKRILDGFDEKSRVRWVPANMRKKDDSI